MQSLVDQVLLAQEHRRVTVAPFNLVSDFGASPNNTGDANSVAWEAMLNRTALLGKVLLRVPVGEYAFARTCQGRSGLRVWGDGEDQTIFNVASVQAGGDGSSSHYVGISFRGSTGNKLALSHDARAGEAEVWLTDASSLAVGDMLLLHSDCPRGRLRVALTSSPTETQVVWDLDAGAADPPAVGELLVESERIAYTSRTISRGTGTAGTDRVTCTIRTLPSTAFGRGNGNYVGINDAQLVDGVDTSIVAHSTNVRVYVFDDAMGRCYMPAAGMFDRGEQHRIQAIDAPGSTAAAGLGWRVVLEEGLYDDYPVAFASGVRKVIPMADWEISDLAVNHTSTLRDVSLIEYGIHARYCDNFKISNVHARWSGAQNVTLDSCTNWRVNNVRVTGKAQADVEHAFYAIAVFNASQWGEITNCHASRSYWTTVFTCSSAGQSVWGEPRNITVTGCGFENAGINFYRAHGGYIVHGGGQHITFAGNTADGVSIGYCIQSGRHITVDGGGNIAGWRRALVTIGDRSAKIRDITVKGIGSGPRHRGPGRTTLSANLAVDATSIQVVDTRRLIDNYGTASIAISARIDSEVVRITATTATTLTVQRAQHGTTAATHASGAELQILGSDSANLIYMNLRPCVFARRAYDQPIRTLQTGYTPGDTTLDVGDTTGWPAASATVPRLVQIEGEDATRYFEPGVLIYTGQTSTHLTGVSVAQLGPPDVAHSAGVFAAPFEWAVSDVNVEGVNGRNDHDSTGISIVGYVPTRNCSLANTSVTYTGDSPSTVPAGVDVMAHNFVLDGVRTHGYRRPFVARGSNIRIVGDCAGTLGAQDTTGGPAVTVNGTNCTVKQFRGERTYQGVRATAGASVSVASSTFQVSSADRALLADTGATLSSRDCLYLDTNGNASPVGSDPKVYEAIIGDGTSTSFSIAHALNRANPQVIVAKRQSYTPTASNLFANPILAADATGWVASNSSGATITTAARAAMPDSDGGFGWHTVGTNPSASLRGFGPKLSVTGIQPGTPYAWGFAFLSIDPPSDPARGLRVDGTWYDAGDVIVSTFTGVPVTGVPGARQKLAGTAVAPDGAARLELTPRAVTAISGDTIDVYVTGAIVVIGTTVPRADLLDDPVATYNLTYNDTNTLTIDFVVAPDASSRRVTVFA